MADNVPFTAGAATYTGASDGVTYSGDAAQVQLVRKVKTSGPENSRTVGTVRHHRVNTGTDNVNISANPCELHSFYAFNNGSDLCFLKFHDTSGTPTNGASVAESYALPVGVPVYVPFEDGNPFASGLGMTLIKDTAGNGVADATATAVTSGTVVTNIRYTRTS